MNGIYADNAATTEIDPDALSAMYDISLNNYANPSQPYHFSKKNKELLTNARNIIAKCIGAEPNEIYFTSGGSESDNWAIKGTFNVNSYKKQIITTEIEHYAVLKSCEYMKSLGEDVIYLKPSSKGVIDIEQLQNVITNKTRIVSVMMANNEIGSIQPIKELCKIAHDNGALFHTDAVQVIGHIPINVKELDVDLLSASAHKFNGPKGIGFLYVKNGTSINPLIHGGHQENNMRAGTENIAYIVGMAIALEKNCNNIQNNMNKVKELEDRFVHNIGEEKIDCIFNGAPEHIPGIVSISIKDENGESLFYRMNLKGVYISTGSACNGVSDKLSHVIKSINVKDNYAYGTIRISLGKNNTMSDVDYITSILGKMVRDK